MDSMDLPSLVVLGPQTSFPSAEHLSQLRLILLNDRRLTTFLTELKNLASFWKILADADSSLNQVPGLQSLEDITNWIDRGDFPVQISETLPNVLSTPLTVIIHIVEYFNYLKHLGPSVSHSQILNRLRVGGIQGFCTGFLTAVALACSSDEEEVNQFGAVALRLAVCIGAYVDLDGRFASPPCETSSLAVRWTQEIGKPRVLDVMKAYPGAYISVLLDTTSATITIPVAAATSLMRCLSEVGVIAKPIGLSGRFHSSVHERALERIQTLCECNAGLQFPARTPLVPLRANSNAMIITEGSLHEIALRSMLTEVSDWHLTITASILQLSDLAPKGSHHVLEVGLIECIPRPKIKELNLRVTNLRGTKILTSWNDTRDSAKANPATAHSPDSKFSEYSYPDHAIAIVGMGCRFPGADTVEEFWDVIQSGKSMLEELPEQRFSTHGLRRTPDMSPRFLGNFIRDADAFDHHFFKKSSREASSMDPQHRLVLQVAYETLESSGYFSEKSPPKDIGCYMGVAASDYEDNVASHPPTAFSVLGMVRAFVSGKISHFFGWNGPSMVFDTACSSSAVAIHSACKAIQTGECSMALAGGVNVITSPILHQNLAAANFLSPTGASKAFDANADGYCRGEGAGLVLLKKLQSAIAGNDKILGVLVGSAVNQNDNCVSITVPVSASQNNLYRRVLSLASLEPKKVSFVEAHGTGTPKGDPIECESIRSVFGGEPDRELYFGSVKGNIGHTEAASGAAGLIKVLLMMQHKAIPMQASFTKLNPAIASLRPSNMTIPTSTRSWNENFLAACVNNYGAAGSNAAMIVCQPPAETAISDGGSTGFQTTLRPKYPMFISAQSPASLQRYCLALKGFIAQKSSLTSEKLLASIAFNLAYRQNHSLAYVVTATAASLAELDDQLSVVASESNKSESHIKTEAKPVVLFFAGQTSNSISFCEQAYHDSLLIHFHLNQCDKILRSMGLRGLFPDIFKTEPIDDVIHLHCMLFSLQYSCARSWIDSGLEVKTVIGHSFGQLTALCVAGSLSLEDALKLVSGRASLIENKWGLEKGSMISLETDINNVTRIASLTEQSGSGYKVEIACYNGPFSYVLVGSEASIKAVEEIIAHHAPSLGPIKTNRVRVTHGFHSAFVDDILPDYIKLAESLTFKKPTIRLETCSEDVSWTQIGPNIVAQQSREPVYFAHAVGRIEQRLGSCTWIEAGSGTPAMSLVRRALHASTNSPHSFHSVKLHSPDPMGSLTDTTINLWKAGVKVQFWPFHRIQKSHYFTINLPPYQFEKSRHWLNYVEKHEMNQSITSMPVESDPALLAFLGFSGSHEEVAKFTVHQTSEQYKACVQGHAVLASNLCPASLYIEIAVGAAKILKPDSSSLRYIPQLDELEMYTPLGVDLNRGVQISLSQIEGSFSGWQFVLNSYGRDDPSRLSQHATGRISLLSSNSSKGLAEFSRYARLVDYKRCEVLLAEADTGAIQGSLVYKMFDKVVHYAEIYQGVRKISSRNQEVAGHVVMPSIDSGALKKFVCNPIAIDNFTQVAGLQVNNLNECGSDEIFVCTKIDRLQISDSFDQVGSESGSWIIYSNFDRKSDRELVNDIYVFDTVSKDLVMMILGVKFTRVVISSLQKTLARANPVEVLANSNAGNTFHSESHFNTLQSVEFNAKLDQSEVPATGEAESSESTKAKDIGQTDVRLAVRELLRETVNVAMDEISEHSTLEDLGIDSLMATEVLNGIKQMFDVDIPVVEFQEILDFKSLCQSIHSRCSSSVSVSSNSSLESSYKSTPNTRDSPIPNGEMSESYSDLVSKLSKLVAEHLDTPDQFSSDTNLGDAGLDSLLGIELGTDIETAFGAKIDLMQLNSRTTFGDLSDMVLPRKHAPIPAATSKIGENRSDSGFLVAKSDKTARINPTVNGSTSVDQRTDAPKCNDMAYAAEDFANIRHDYLRFARETGFADFRAKVYPKQAQLVLAYVVEAFAALGCDLDSLKTGDRLPSIHHVPKHGKVMSQYYKVLEDASLISITDTAMVRTDTPVNDITAKQLHEQILSAFPQHESEHRLLNSTGSKLADCLSGRTDPLQVLFHNKADRDLLEEVYTNSPMFATGTKLLGNFFSKIFQKYRGRDKLRILELGAGTGGTTKYILDRLLSLGIDFTYTFTDLSSSMVAAAKKKFAGYACMEYMVLDVEKTPPGPLVGSYHTILSSNCIHATKSLLRSSTNVYKMLRSDGFLCLLELTRNLFWLDCVFGLLEGWWLFEDGRNHVLADEFLWKETLLKAGFNHVDWSDDETEESDQFRVITGFVSKPQNFSVPNSCTGKAIPLMETVEFSRVGETSLCADIYYPTQTEMSQAKRPIALMIHGGGHIMLSRKDIRPKQTRLLLENGLLPVSVDYRLCPEVTLTQGPIPDVCSALQWARHILPSLNLERPDIHPDGDKVAIIGWSTGGTLSMSLAWTAPQKGLKPPEAILAFYCPTDYESEFWRQPNYPEGTESLADEDYDLLEGVKENPITSYNVPADKRAAGGWMSTSDSRSRIALHMNWRGQALPVLLGGLPSKIQSSASSSSLESWLSLPQPDPAQVASVSPYAQIDRGNYRVPTFLIHGTKDDLIPWQHTKKVRDALVNRGVPTGMQIVEGGVHLFDLGRDVDARHWQAVRKGYEFLLSHLGMTLR